MGLSEAAVIELVEKNEEFIARHAVMRDALDHARRVAKNALLPESDQPEALRRVIDICLRAEQLCDSLLTAAWQRGYEIADEEIVALARSVGGFHFLTPEGQVKFVAARMREGVRLAKEAKRAAAAASNEEPKSLRAHGSALLKLHRDAEPKETA